jgi:hypothetical protein
VQVQNLNVQTVELKRLLDWEKQRAVHVQQDMNSHFDSVTYKMVICMSLGAPFLHWHLA